MSIEERVLEKTADPDAIVDAENGNGDIPHRDAVSLLFPCSYIPHIELIIFTLFIHENREIPEMLKHPAMEGVILASNPTILLICLKSLMRLV